MMPFFPAGTREQCIFIDGPLKGRVDLLCCLGAQAPCDTKDMIINDKLYTYRLATEDGLRLKDGENRWILEYEPYATNVEGV